MKAWMDSNLTVLIEITQLESWKISAQLVSTGSRIQFPFAINHLLNGRDGSEGNEGR